MKVVVAGDYCPQLDLLGPKRCEQIVDDLSSVADLLSHADYSLVNLEAPVINGSPSPIAKVGDHLSLRQEDIDALEKVGFRAVTMANNHIRDYGDEGVRSTLGALDRIGVAHVGCGLNEKDARQTLYVTTGKGTLAVLNVCEHEFSVSSEGATAHSLRPIALFHDIVEAKAKSDYLLLIVHGGHEYYPLPSPRMQELYRFFIDAGADAVVNHHQHCVSGCEYYKDRPIAYGLGNFYFGVSTSRPDWNVGCLAELDFQPTKVHLRLHPYRSDRKEEDGFDQKILSLNAIIQDSGKLKASWKTYAESRRNSMLTALSPYSNRWMQALLRRGWLPKFLQQKRMLQIANYIDCESHRDVLSFLLSAYESTNRK